MYADLEKEQNMLAKKISLVDKFSVPIRMVGGISQAFYGNKIISASVVLDYRDLEVKEKTYCIDRIDFPYIPTFLFFREGRAAIKSYQKLKTKPDIVFIHGHGISHPRGIGMASHMALVLNIATIGIAKSILCGEFKTPEKGPEKMFLNKRHVGWVVGGKHKPIFISPGHNISIQSSLKISFRCLKEHRLPEPLFQAHLYANEVKRGYENHKT